MNQPEVTETDRQRYAQSLQASVVSGAMSLDEFEAKIGVIYAAQTIAQLEALFPSVPVRRPARRGTNAAVLLGGAVAIVAVLLVVVAILALRSPGPTTGTQAATASSLTTDPVTAAAKALHVAIVPAGIYARHDPADKCGETGTATKVGGANCYLVVRFTNVSSSAVTFDPADLKMTDQFLDSDSTQSVIPACYDSVDINTPQTLGPKQGTTLQLCYPVMTGSLPQGFVGTGSLSGLSASVPPNAVIGTWGGA